MTNDCIRILREKSESPSTRLAAILQIMDRFNPEYFDVFEEILNDSSEDPEVRSAIALTLGKIGQVYLQHRFSNDFFHQKRFLSHAESAGSSEYYAEPFVNQATRQPIEKHLLMTLLPHVHSDDITLKNYVIQALGMLGCEEAAPTLIEALKDDSNEIFASAAEALGQLGASVAPYLIRLLEIGADDARCVAAWKLGELRADSAVSALAQTIEHQRNPEVLALSIWALGEIGVSCADEVNVVALLNRIKRHENPDVSSRAVMALKKIARHTN